MLSSEPKETTKYRAFYQLMRRMLKLIFFSGCHWGKALHTGLSLEVLREWHSLQNQFRFVVKNIFSLKFYRMTHMQVTEMSGRALSRCRDKKEAKCFNGLCPKLVLEDLTVLWVVPFGISHRSTEIY